MKIIFNENEFHTIELPEEISANDLEPIVDRLKDIVRMNKASIEIQEVEKKEEKEPEAKKEANNQKYFFTRDEIIKIIKMCYSNLSKNEKETKAKEYGFRDLHNLRQNIHNFIRKYNIKKKEIRH